MFFFKNYFKKIIYFDNSSTNQKPNILFKSIINIIQKKNFNINRGNYNLIIKNNIFFKKIKFLIKKLLNLNFLEELIFFSNSTYSINFVFFNLLKLIKKNNEILLSNKEHNSIFLPILKLLSKKQIKIIVFPTIKNNININLFCNYIKKNTFICIINAISNNFGLFNKIKNISNICLYNNILLLIDVTQSISYLNVNLKKIKTCFVFFSLHKLYSLTGVSILYININFIKKIKPIYYGGGSIYYNNYKFLFKKFDEKFYFGTKNIFSIYSSYYSIKWFLENKYYIFFKNFLIKKIIFLIFKKKNFFFTNIILLNYNDIFFLNRFFDKNKILLRCDNLCNFLKNMFINKKKNCRISYNFFNKIKDFFKIKFLIFFFNFRIKNY